MSKSGQRRASEMQRRRLEHAAKRKRTMALPVGATGLLVLRGQERRIDNVQMAGSQSMRRSVATWIAESRSDFFLYVARLDGRLETWEFDDVDSMKLGVESVLEAYVARRAACVIHTLADAVLEEIMEETVGAHVVTVTAANERGRSVADGVKLSVATDEVRGRSVLLRIDGRVVRSQETVGVLRALDTLVASADQVVKNWMSLRIGIGGWDDDARELFEVQEVRQFLATIAAAAPWWVALVAPADYLTWFGAITPISEMSRSQDASLSLRFAPGYLEHRMGRAGLEAMELLRRVDADVTTRDRLLEALSGSLEKLASTSRVSF